MIFPKIREVDAVLRRRRRVPVFETHPELGFCMLNGRQPLEYSKNLADGQKGEGFSWRRVYWLTTL